ncbi:MAG TPA: hypothetical protein VG935_04165 [Patescibacteria group bacterium]|nr:hypothetical protein [Patescibacteria group bacterium]
MADQKWFRAKRFGWGWTPATIQGWIITILAALFVAWFTIVYLQRLRDPLFNPIVSTIIYLVLVSTVSISLMIICFKTGEKPRWSWPASTQTNRSRGNKKRKKS